MTTARDGKRGQPGGAAAYLTAVAIPVLAMAVVTWLNLPPFVFEHLIVLLVLGIAIPWGLRPAVVTAVVSVLSDNVLLREPIGRPAITGVRDVLDLLLFATVAIVVGELARRMHVARAHAQEAAECERRAREEYHRLIAAITHDLATPLSVLTGMVHVARVRGFRSEAHFSRLLDRLETAGARASSLLATLSDARALEGDGLQLDLATYDLRELVIPIATMMDRFSERHQVRLEVPNHPAIIEGDANRMQRVLENLVNNAIKYSPKGGEVEVSVAIEGPQVILRVRDHGMGITPAALPWIFHRSYRAPEAEAQAPGLGLGLSIAAQVVEKHGGAIDAAPAPGGGTVVTVRLPRVAPESPAVAAPSEQPRDSMNMNC